MAEDWWCLLIALAFSIGPDTGNFLPAWLIHESIQQVLVVFANICQPRCASLRTGAVCLGHYLYSNANLSVLSHGCSKPASVLWSASGLGISCFLSTEDGILAVASLKIYNDLQHYFHSWGDSEPRIASTQCFLLDCSAGTATSAWYVPERPLQLFMLQFGFMHRAGKSSAPQGESFPTSTPRRTNLCLLALLPALCCCRWLLCFWLDVGNSIGCGTVYSCMFTLRRSSDVYIYIYWLFKYGYEHVCCQYVCMYVGMYVLM